MIRIHQFEDEKNEIIIYGALKRTPKLQSYSKNRTIGSRIKQRWIGSYDTISIEVFAISKEDYEATILELFKNRVLLTIIEENGDESYGTLVGDSLNLSTFVDVDEKEYYKGTLDFES